MYTRFILATAVLTLAHFTEDKFEDTFNVEKASFVATGANDYFSIAPGTKHEYAGGGTKLVITVLDQTKTVDGVQTRVVEEREWEDGKLIEVSRNYFALDSKTNDVYYFGEDVDMYKDGKIVNHEGSWQAGNDSTRFGLMMPAKPTANRAYYQEVAPKIAMDRAKIVDLKAKVTTPAGTFENCVKVEETTPLEKGAKEYKYYAPGVGLVQDSEVKLTKRTSGA
jgi:hypothetical protein